jgi:nitroreductase
MVIFDQLVRDRHSTRKFLPRPVPRSLIDESLALAQLAPSNSNIQPWQMLFATGAARDRLTHALLDVAKQEAPHIPPLPQQFTHFRSELGSEVYGKGMGITRENKEGRAAAVLRNYDFFGAPLVGIVCMHRDLDAPDALSVGMYLQTLLLALTEHGLGTCVEVSVAGYPEIIRKELDVAPELLILCGVAIGYSDPDFPANQLHIFREAVEQNIVFYDN